MVRTERAKIILVIYLVINLLWLGFIFGHSLAPSEESREESGSVLSWVNRFLSPIGLELTMHQIRKCAHFAEFFIAGALFCGWIPLLGKKILASLPSVLFASLFTAVCDEGIQIFTGRGPMVSDVWLDFAGTVCAILIVLPLTDLFRKKKGKEAV